MVSMGMAVRRFRKASRQARVNRVANERTRSINARYAAVQKYAGHDELKPRGLAR